MIKDTLKKDKKTNLSSWKREYFVSAIVAIVILLFSVFFVKGAVQKMLRLSSENKKLKSKLSFLIQKVRLLEDVDVDRLNSEVMMIEMVFPSQKPSLKLLAVLSSLSREENVLLSAIELFPGKLEEISGEEEIKRTESIESSKMRDFSVEFSIEGELANVSQFIARLEKIAPIMKIESFGLNLIKDKETEVPRGRVEVSLIVRSFYKDWPKTIGKIEQKLPPFTSEEERLLVKLSEFETEKGLLPDVPVGRENLFE